MGPTTCSTSMGVASSVASRTALLLFSTHTQKQTPSSGYSVSTSRQEHLPISSASSFFYATKLVDFTSHTNFVVLSCTSHPLVSMSLSLMPSKYCHACCLFQFLNKLTALYACHMAMFGKLHSCSRSFCQDYSLNTNSPVHSRAGGVIRGMVDM